MEDIVHLIAQAVQRGTDDVIFVAAAGQAHDGSAGVLIPVGRTEAGEGGHHITAVGVLHLPGHILGVAGFFQQSQLVPQPLDGRTGHEDGTFQRIIHAFFAAARNGRDKAVFRDDRRFAGVHQQKAAGAEGVLRLTRRKAGLPEERGLLVARCACNFDARTKVHRVGLRVEAAGRHGRGQHTARDIQLPQDVLIPLQRVDVEQHRAAGVGVVGHMDPAAGQLPDEPGLHRAEQQPPGLGLFPRTGHVVQDPFQFGGGEVCVNDQTRLCPEGLGQAPRLEFVAVGAGAAALPDDGMIDRLPGLPVPDDGGLALVRDADSRDVRRAGPDLVHGRERHAQLRGPDLVCVMLHPARLREILGELFLSHAAHLARLVEQDAAVRGRPGIQRHDIVHIHVPFLHCIPLASWSCLCGCIITHRPRDCNASEPTLQNLQIPY